MQNVLIGKKADSDNMFSPRRKGYLITLLLVSSIFSLAFTIASPSYGTHSDVTVETDDITYGPGDEVSITGTLGDVDESEDEVDITVKDPDGSTDEFTVDRDDDEFSKDFDLDSNADEGRYTVKATYNGESIYTYFEVIEDEDDDPISLDADDDTFDAGGTVELDGTVEDVDPDEDQVDVSIRGPGGSQIDSFNEDVENDGDFNFNYDFEDDADHGIYAIEVEYGSDTAVVLVEVREQEEQQDITVTTDKSIYQPDNIVRITGEIGDVNPAEDQVNVVVKNPDNDEIEDEDVDLESDDTFLFAFSLDEESEDGIYTVTVTYDGKSESVSFTVSSGSGSTGGVITSPNLSVKLDKSTYLPGETITITGKVAKLVRDGLVNVIAYSPVRSLAGTSDSVTPDSSSLTYTATVKLKPGLQTGDKYKISVTYGSDQTDVIFSVKGTEYQGGSAPLTVKTDKAQYKPGETITISGQISPDTISSSENKLVLQVYNPNEKPYRIEPVPISGDGTYSYQLVVGGDIGIPGKYEIIITYNGEEGNASFDLIESVTGKAKYSLKVDTDTYPIEYEINGAALKGMFVKQSEKKLVISLDAAEEGRLVIILPREVIDARNGNSDSDFLVATTDIEAGVENSDISVEEGTATDAARTITIDFESGTDLIEISGTTVVPEFGPISAIVLAISILAIIALTARHGRKSGLGFFIPKGSSVNSGG